MFAGTLTGMFILGVTIDFVVTPASACIFSTRLPPSTDSLTFFRFPPSRVISPPDDRPAGVRIVTVSPLTGTSGVVSASATCVLVCSVKSWPAIGPVAGV